MIPETVPEIYVMQCFDASALFKEVLETILTVLPFDLLDRYLFNRRRRNNAFYIPITNEQVSSYRVSSKTVSTWLFALLSASTHENFKSWDIFVKFRKFATK